MNRSCRLLHGQPRQPFEWKYFSLLTEMIVLSNKKKKFEKIFSSFFKHFPKRKVIWRTLYYFFFFLYLFIFFKFKLLLIGLKQFNDVKWNLKFQLEIYNFRYSPLVVNIYFHDTTIQLLYIHVQMHIQSDYLKNREP